MGIPIKLVLSFRECKTRFIPIDLSTKEWLRISNGYRSLNKDQMTFLKKEGHKINLIIKIVRKL